VNRCWARVRRRAHRRGVRPLKLHAATLALEAGKSVRWVADQLGHADPALTLRVHAHALATDPGDLGFVDSSRALSSDGPTAPDGPSR